MRHLFLLTLLCIGLGAARAQRARSSDASATIAAQAQALREVQRLLYSLEDRMAVIEQQQRTLQSRIDRLEHTAPAVSKDEVDALRADLTKVSSAQGKLRDEIVEDITKKIVAMNEKRDAADRKAREAAQKAAQKSGYNHVVEAGQTLSAIAQAYKVSVKSIMQANKITDPTKIRIGQQLFIPDP